MVIGDGSCAWASLGFAGVTEGGWDNAAERARLIAARNENGTRRSGLRHSVAEQTNPPGCIISSIWQQWCPCSVRVLSAIHRESAPKRCPRLLGITGIWQCGVAVSLGRNYPPKPKVAGSKPAPATNADQGVTGASAAKPLALPRHHPRIAFQLRLLHR